MATLLTRMFMVSTALTIATLACKPLSTRSSDLKGVSLVLGERASGFIPVRNDFGTLKATDANSRTIAGAVDGSVVFALVECAASSGVQAEVWFKNLEIQTNSTINSSGTVGIWIDQNRKLHAPPGTKPDPATFPCAVLSTRFVTFPVLKEMLTFSKGLAKNPKNDVWSAAQAFYLLLRGFSYDANPSMNSPMLDAMKLAQGLHGETNTNLDDTMRELDLAYNPCNVKSGAAVTAKGDFKCAPLKTVAISTFLPKGGDTDELHDAIGKVGAYIENFHRKLYSNLATVASTPASCTASLIEALSSPKSVATNAIVKAYVSGAPACGATTAVGLALANTAPGRQQPGGKIPTPNGGRQPGGGGRGPANGGGGGRQPSGGGGLTPDGNGARIPGGRQPPPAAISNNYQPVNGFNNLPPQTQTILRNMAAMRSPAALSNTNADQRNVLDSISGSVNPQERWDVTGTDKNLVVLTNKNGGKAFVPTDNTTLGANKGLIQTWNVPPQGANIKVNGDPVLIRTDAPHSEFKNPDNSISVSGMLRSASDKNPNQLGASFAMPSGSDAFYVATTTSADGKYTQPDGEKANKMTQEHLVKSFSALEADANKQCDRILTSSKSDEAGIQAAREALTADQEKVDANIKTAKQLGMSDEAIKQSAKTAGLNVDANGKITLKTDCTGGALYLDCDQSAATNSEPENNSTANDNNTAPPDDQVQSLETENEVGNNEPTDSNHVSEELNNNLEAPPEAPPEPATLEPATPEAADPEAGP